jgi:4-hydroxy-3-polyprenylbenzoate decarboxylase
MPVVVGALSASPRIYGIGMGKPIEEIGEAWLHAISHPIAPVRVTNAPCQEVVIKGADLKKKDGGLKLLPVPISTPGFDAAPYLTATLCITKDPESGVQNMGTYRGQLKATDRLGVRMASRIGGAGGYAHWLKYRKLKKPMPCAFVIGCAPVVVFTGPQKLPIDQDEMGVAGALAGEPIRTVKCVTIDLDVPADAEIVIEGLVDPELLEPEGPFGESHGYVALEDFNMSMQVTAITHKKKPVFVSIISQVHAERVERHQEGRLRADVPVAPARPARHQGHPRGVAARTAVQRAAGDLPEIRQGTPRTEVWRGIHGASGCAPIAARSSSRLATTSTRPTPTRCSGRWPIAQSGRGRACGAASLQRPRPEVRPRAQRFIAADRRHAEAAFPPLALPTREFMDAPARSGTSSNCRRCRRSRRGTAIRSATGTTPGRPMPSARSPAAGNRAARKLSRRSAAD